MLDEAGDALYLAQVQSPHAIRYASWRGRRVPGAVSALGLALQGSRPPVVRRDAVEPGVTAVAAPVHGASGAVVAALSVTGPSFRLDDAAVAPAAVALARERPRSRAPSAPRPSVPRHIGQVGDVPGRATPYRRPMDLSTTAARRARG